MEATCPLVRVAHRAVAKLVREGYHPVIVGKREHVEVRGLTEDLGDFDVVLSEADVLELRRAGALWRSGADHAADREGAGAGGTDSPALSRFRSALH